MFNKLYLIVFSALLLSVGATGISSTKKLGFDIKKIPSGASVTLPQPATTVFPLTDRITLTATDMPQTIKFRPAHLRNKRYNKVIELAIYDSNQERVKYIRINPNLPTLYRFHSLGSISVVPKTPAVGGNVHLRVIVESDKPLEISR